MIKNTVICLSILLVSAASGSCYEEQSSYSGYAVYRCTPRTTFQLNLLNSLNEKQNDGFQFWIEPTDINKTVDVMVAPEKQEQFDEQLTVFRLPARRILHDVGETIRRNKKVSTPRLVQTYRDGTNITVVELRAEALEPRAFYTKFHSYSVIELKLNKMAEDPRVQLEVIGKSTENRDLYLIKVSSDPERAKPVIFIDAGHHAREWVSHSTLLYIVDSLLGYNMPEVRAYESENGSSLLRGFASTLDKYDIWFLPVVNPDGYEYTHTTDRLWRKTRSRNIICRGVDPNRNYDFHWAESGASSFACDQTYAGPRPFSEPETRALADVLDTNAARIKMYLSLHAYSQVLLSPYGFDRSTPANYEQLKRVANAGIRALYSVRGTMYRFGTSAQLLYPAAGGSDDYAYGHSNIRYSYTMELPDVGQNGFLMPAEEIIPIGQETVAGIAAMIRALP